MSSQQQAKQYLEVSIVASDKPIWKGSAKYVVFPGYDGGATGILPNHEPTITLTSAGVVRVDTLDNDKLLYDVSDGFAMFENNRLTISVFHGDIAEH